MEGDVGTINNLEAGHTIALRTVLSNILSTSHTIGAYAGIIDGLIKATITYHGTTVLLFQKPDGGFHKGCEDWNPKPTTTLPFGAFDSVHDPVPNPQPTVFFHGSYEAFD